MNIFLMSLASGACFLLGFLLLLQQEERRPAFRWLAFFILIMGIAFLGIYWTGAQYGWVASLNSLQFLLAPCLLLGVSHFADKDRLFRKKDILHFLPFVLYWVADLSIAAKGTLLSLKLFSIGSADLLLRDILPVQLLIYIACAYRMLRGKGQGKGRMRYLLLTLLLITLFWINDALFGIGFLMKVMPLAYTGSVFLLAYFVLKGRSDVIPTTESPTPSLSAGKEEPEANTPRASRLDRQQLSLLSGRLEILMTGEKIFLDNELSLPQLAERLGISVHDTSYLINEATGNSYHHLVNSRRVEEAKRLLSSGEAGRLNMVGIAFAAGFNSKTAFNTAFKKWTGLSPTAFRQEMDREKCSDG
ncbi:helix-turn-helix domain-containing protein [Taibaiella koreensis]|uniref:helix-turn-helix domain-containing protein n=1 Tax=Taibaiella koreensis TaxID=1268548 RepID=UPI000E59A391|nr:AraC family transcriptional regulator [Taibaiella koreensis]